MLPSLPLPGTLAFAKLIAALQPFNVTPQDVTFDAPGNRLADLTLTLALVRREILLRITHEGLEVSIGSLLDEHIPLVPSIADAALVTLREIDAEAAYGMVRLSYLAHLGLPPKAASRVLSGHIQGLPSGEFLPEGFSYRIRFEGRPDILSMRIVVARSVFFEEALYVDFQADYEGGRGSEEMARTARQDVFEVLGRLQLEFSANRS